MPARRQHGCVALLLIVGLVLSACSHDIPTQVAAFSSPAPTVPHVRIAGLHGSTGPISFDDLVAEATEPAAMRQALLASGFVSGAERTLAGGRGAFSRVVVRAWGFASEEEAVVFLKWLQGNAAELIGEVAPVNAAVPGGVVLLLHAPTGCCHQEVPIYFAAWQRGATLWTIRASGARIHTAPVVALVRSVEKET